jgi:L-ascorbate 6-phosphate lactonase
MDYRIRWIGQAGYILEAGGRKLAIDPYCSDSMEPLGFIRQYPSLIPRNGLSVDTVISTHPHGDHLDTETLTDYISFDRFYGPGSCVDVLSKAGFRDDKLFAFDRGQTVADEDFKFTAVFADHTPDSIGVIIEHEGIRIYFTGDSLFNERLFEARKLSPDIIFVCINGKFGNMNWREAAELCRRLEVKTAVPAHYDMFAVNSENPEFFMQALKTANIKSMALERGREYPVASLL